MIRGLVGVKVRVSASSPIAEKASMGSKTFEHCHHEHRNHQCLLRRKLDREEMIRAHLRIAGVPDLRSQIVPGVCSRGASQ